MVAAGHQHHPVQVVVVAVAVVADAQLDYDCMMIDWSTRQKVPIILFASSRIPSV